MDRDRHRLVRKLFDGAIEVRNEVVVQFVDMQRNFSHEVMEVFKIHVAHLMLDEAMTDESINGIFFVQFKVAVSQLLPRD